MIETHSGYIWWAGHAHSPLHACELAEAETSGTDGALYFEEFSESDAHAGTQGYAVYKVPCILADNIDDGQDPDAIDLVQSHALVARYQLVQRPDWCGVSEHGIDG